MTRHPGSSLMSATLECISAAGRRKFQKSLSDTAARFVAIFFVVLYYSSIFVFLFNIIVVWLTLTENNPIHEFDWLD